jgi:hypothetical protein
LISLPVANPPRADRHDGGAHYLSCYFYYIILISWQTACRNTIHMGLADGMSVREIVWDAHFSVN